MGIIGLLPQLKSITTKVHVEIYKGLKVGIDAHCWLHRGGYSCSKELAEGISTTKYVQFCISMLQMLKKHGVTDIIVVLDGASLPVKGIRNKERREFREKNKTDARAAAEDGNSELAMKHYQRSVSITPEMVQNLIQALKKEGVDFIVSPYESDAQLSYLSKAGIVDLVISEDSDLLVYGCKRVLYKLDVEGMHIFICLCICTFICTFICEYIHICIYTYTYSHA
jgi:exonuclease-1